MFVGKNWEKFILYKFFSITLGKIKFSSFLEKVRY